VSMSADIDPHDVEHVEAAADLVWSITCLIYNLSTQRQNRLRERLTSLFGEQISDDQIGQLTGYLPADIFL